LLLLYNILQVIIKISHVDQNLQFAKTNINQTIGNTILILLYIELYVSDNTLNKTTQQSSDY
jgi:hypothetical protein